MANYGTTTHRSISTSTSTSNSNPTPAKQTHEPKSSLTRRININLTLPWPFSIPSNPEAAIARIARNLAYFKLHYILFLWAALFIGLIISGRAVGLLLLVLMTNFTIMYLLLLKAMPNSVLLKIIDKRLVLAFLALGTAVGLIVARAGLHLLITLACTTSVMLGHALLQENNGLMGGDLGGSSVGGDEIGLLNGKEAAEDKV